MLSVDVWREGKHPLSLVPLNAAVSTNSLNVDFQFQSPSKTGSKVRATAWRDNFETGAYDSFATVTGVDRKL
jgi:hypothetical protein